MAESVAIQSSTNQVFYIIIDYTAGGGVLTINGIKGMRTDSYGDTTVWNADNPFTLNVGSQTKPIKYVGFGQNSNYLWWNTNNASQGGSTSVGLSFSATGTNTYTIYISGSGNTRVDEQRFSWTVDSGSPVTTPTLSGVSVGGIARTSANASFTVTNNGGAPIVDNYIDCGTYNFGNVVSTITGTSGSFSNLTPNTTYYVRANASNGSYRGYSAVGSFKTTGNAPSISSVSTTPTTTTCDFVINVSYDTNDGFSSRTIQYGTTTSYGSSVSGTQITGLTPNTTYYYKVTVNSTQGRSGTYTGSFQTLSAIGKVRYKVNGTWKNANTYIKVNGAWELSDLKLKVNGTWKKGV